MTEAHQPPSSSYVAAHIVRPSPTGPYELELQNLYQGSLFPNRLLGLKVENHTGETIEIKLVANRSDTDTTSPSADNGCTIASISGAAWIGPDGPFRQGAWVWTNDETTRVHVWVLHATGADSYLGAIPIWVCANRITMHIGVLPPAGTGGPVAKSLEGTRVFCNKHVDPSDQVLRLRVLLRNRDPENAYVVTAGTTSVTVAAPPSTDDPVDQWLYLPDGVTTVSVKRDSEATGTEFEVYDAGGSIVTLVDHDGKIASAPYAVTGAGASKQIKVINASSHPVRVWRQGEGSVSIHIEDFEVPIAPDPDPKNPVTFTFPTMTFTHLQKPVTRTTAKQWTLHWASSDDPKVIVKQQDCGG